MKEHHVPESACPSCGYKMNGAMNTQGERAPEAGDLSVCINCGHLLTYGEGLALQLLTDFDGIDSDRVMELLRARRAVLAVRKTPQ